MPARASHAVPIRRRTLVLDADGVSKLARRDRRTRAMVRAEVDEFATVVVIPPIAALQALVEGIGRRALDDVLAGGRRPDVDDLRIDLAASLMVRTHTLDVPDALIAAEALLNVPAIVLTSDPSDLAALLDADSRGERVEMWQI